MSIYHRRAYTLVEIMIVTAIIAIIVTITVPNYLKEGRVAAKNACITNLRQIDGAIEQWALANNIGVGTVPSAEDEVEIYNYVKGGRPACPSNGEYTIYSVGSKPQVRCSRESDEDHELPE